MGGDYRLLQHFLSTSQQIETILFNPVPTVQRASSVHIAKTLSLNGTSQRLYFLESQLPASAQTYIKQSYSADMLAYREIGLTVCDHRQHKGLNNRAENSHQQIRLRERVMKRFKSARHLQRFTSIHDPIYNLHYFPRNRFTSSDFRQLRQAATNMWREIARLKFA